MGLIREAVTSLIPATRALEEGPFPLTAARLLEVMGGTPTATGMRVSPESALSLTAVWDAVDMISGDIARTPVPLYQRTNQGRTKADANRLHYLLNTAPNPYMTAYTFKQALQGHKMLRGNAFANIERDSSGEPVALWPLRADVMERPVISQAGTLIYRYTMENGTQVLMPQSEVLHLRGFSNDGIWGMSPITVHRETIALGMAYRAFSAKFFGNNASPGGVLQVKQRLTKEAAERLREQWEIAHKGMDNAMRVAVLEDGVTWQAVGMALDDAQYIESSKLNRIEVASIWHIPAHKVGELDRATFTNIEEQDLDYEGAVLDREYANWDQQLNKDLLLPQQQATFYFEFMRQALVRATIDKRSEAYSRAWWMKPNEIRDRENMDRIPEFDEPFIPANNVLPLSLVVKKVDAEIEKANQPALPAPVRQLRRTDEGYELRLVSGD